MNLNEIVHILKKDFQPRITVFGDFCLDKYLYVDGERDELSLETNLTAYQISHKKLFAGAGGTITNNLLALGARVDCIGIVGNDGEGYELLKCLKNAGADVSLMIQTEERHTGTYIKPKSYIKDETREMNRLDIKNFTSTPRHLEKQLIENLQKILANTNAVIICDQYTEVDCGAVTNFVQKILSNLAYQYKDKIWYVDSRSNIDKFKNTFVTDWSTEKAQQQMENWLNSKPVAEIEELTLIVTHDDEIVDGLMNALEAYSGPATINVKLITSVGGREGTMEKFETTKTGIKFTTFYFAPAFIREALRLSVTHLTGEAYDGAVLKDGQYLIPSFSISNAGSADHDFDSYRASDIYAERYSIGNF